MIENVLRQLVFWILGIFFICLFCFVLLQNIPGDPVIARMQQQGIRHSEMDIAWQSKEYVRWRNKLNLNLPVFYCSVMPATIPESLFDIPNPKIRSTIKNLCYRYGSSEQIINWYNANTILLEHFKIKSSSNGANLVTVVMASENLEENLGLYQQIEKENQNIETLVLVKEAKLQMQNISDNQQSWRSYVPNFVWNGSQNRFHYWLLGDNQYSKGALRGDFGLSYRNSKPVLQILSPALFTTIKLATIVILILYLVSIPLGIKLAQIKSKQLSSYLVHLVLSVYAMPSFWIAILMITFLCNPTFLNWFPAAYSLIEISPETPFITEILLNIWYLILPVTCWALGGVAFLSIQTFKKTQQLSNAPFIITAKAKGLSNKQISTSHLFPNSIIPSLSLLGGILPAAFSGAIAIELIFSISGMGTLIFDAFQYRDYPIIMAVLLFAGITTLIGTGISDLLIAFLDPRIRYYKSDK